MEKLTSLKNPKVLAWRSLKEKKGREERHAFLVEGSRMVREALSSSFPVSALLLREDYVPDFPLPEGLPLYLLPDNVFRAVSDTKTPQGIAAVLALQAREASGRRLLALDGVQDPGNVGTIIRTADAAGFDGILFSPDCADLFSPKVLRSTMGSIFRLGFSFPSSLPQTLEKLKKDGFSVLSSQLDGNPFYERGAVSSSFVLVIGNEGNGVSDAVKAVATHRLCLPMRGGAESLNAAVAAGIMMYDLTR
ncbi:MAG: RNA methyltransferase [Clostridia bacterium]|nr:RNA methyltransferase [Clostridia bacterium]